MILRFDHSFYKGYVQDTVRHDTFEQVSYTNVKQLIHKHTHNLAHRQELLKIWQQRSPEDAYYIAKYRVGDSNVLLRLRAWRPKMEVLLPWELRQQIRVEVAQEQALYWE
jgi:CRISPR-associated protein (TIGR03985 family)